ncbi:hypothetical protein [Parvimonas micra]|nr:hypothetical protein [Parvimonas micra]
MHPKKICDAVASMGARLFLDGNNLYIENPEKIYPELEDFIKSYKPWIVKYLKGEYTKHEHAINETVEKIINFYRGIEQPGNSKINDWLNKDYESTKDCMTLFVLLSENGWTSNEPIASYESVDTDELTQKLYSKAINFFKKGA